MLKLYNTLSRKKEVFKPRTLRQAQGKRKKVNLFVCGITPYDFAHLGHARTYIVFDMIVKYLRENGYNVFYLQNITDIDDKIIKRAKEKKIAPQKLARNFEKEYLKDMKDLKINSVKKYARATDHIKEIISQVKRLLKKGYAYQIEDGIYYNVSKFKDYGKLAKRTTLQAEDGVSRIDEAIEKRNKGDFCLWKFSPKESLRLPTGQAKPKELSWPSPWGPGRPGWHIEDTAITEKYFGPQYDIHGGARDLIFPHHEAEISQMEAISGKSPLVKYWIHSGFLTVNGQKMAKSLGNFITIKDFLKENSPRVLRLFVIKTHYRSPIDYSEKEIEQVKKQLERIDEFVDKIQNSKTELPFMEAKVKMRTKSSSPFEIRNKPKIQISKFQKEFEEAMEDDFNTPKAVAVIFDLINKGNSLIAQNKLASADARDIFKFLREIDSIFNFIFWKRPKVKIPKALLSLAKQRQEYREQELWQKADEIRKQIKEMGYWIEDTKKGPKIKKI